MTRMIPSSTVSTANRSALSEKTIAESVESPQPSSMMACETSLQKIVKGGSKMIEITPNILKFRKIVRVKQRAEQ